MRKVIVLFLLLIVLPVANAIYLGTVDGYVTDMMGIPVSSADVTVEVIGCTGSACSGSTTSESSGYYVVGNLDIKDGDSIRVTAQKGSAYGQNTGTGDQFFTARINVTTCDAPTSPTLIDPPQDNHSNEIFTLNWTSGTDPLSQPTYDILVYNGKTFNNSFPVKVVENLNYTTYSWNVKTCNHQCCSPQASSSFDVFNNLPPMPSLDDVPNGIATTIIFNWSNVTDPDGDEIHYDFQLDGNTEFDVSRPITKESVGGGSHTWKARACDFLGCSNYATDTFSIVNNQPSLPVLTEFDYIDQTTVTFEWTPGVDPDGDDEHDEFQLSTSRTFATTVYDSSNASTPLALDNLDFFDIYYWRVRSCDDKGACSSYATSTFFTYSCPDCGDGSSSGGGSGSRSSGSYVCSPILKEVVMECTIEWQCTEWSVCSVDGKSKRKCQNIGTCEIGDKEEIIECEPDECLFDEDCGKGYICTQEGCVEVAKKPLIVVPKVPKIPLWTVIVIFITSMLYALYLMCQLRTSLVTLKKISGGVTAKVGNMSIILKNNVASYGEEKIGKVDISSRWSVFKLLVLGALRFRNPVKLLACIKAIKNGKNFNR